MPKYIRKKRYHNYHSKSCKKYLRIDFQYECAYCGTHEAESIHGLKSFEIDHFRPRSKFKNDPTIHNYENLYYSCQICNGEKSDDWKGQLLNPCSDEIFVEHIKEEMDEKFKLIPNTVEGTDYIKILKLNQKTQRGIRQVRSRYQLKIEQRIHELERLLDNIKKLEDMDESSAKDALILVQQLQKEIKGPYFELLDELGFDLEYEKAFEKTFNSIINDEVVNFQKVYEEHDLDYEIRTDTKLYRLYVRFEDNINFSNGIKQIRIPVDQATEWISHSNPIIILVFESAKEKIYYTSFNDYVSNNPIVTENLYSVKIYQDNDLVQEKEEFLEIILEHCL